MGEEYVPTREFRSRRYAKENWHFAFWLTFIVLVLFSLLAALFQKESYQLARYERDPGRVEASNRFWEMVDGTRPPDNTTEARFAQDMVGWIGGRDLIDGRTPETPLFTEALADVTPHPDNYPGLEEDTTLAPFERYSEIPVALPYFSDGFLAQVTEYQLEGLPGVLIEPGDIEQPVKRWPYSVLHGWGWLGWYLTLSAAAFAAGGRAARKELSLTGSYSDKVCRFYAPRPYEPVYGTAWSLAPHCMALAWVYRRRRELLARLVGMPRLAHPLLERPRRIIRHRRYRQTAIEWPEVAWAYTELEALKRAPETPRVLQARKQLEGFIQDMGSRIPTELAGLEADDRAGAALARIAIIQGGEAERLDKHRRLADF